MDVLRQKEAIRILVDTEQRAPDTALDIKRCGRRAHPGGGPGPRREGLDRGRHDDRADEEQWRD